MKNNKSMFRKINACLWVVIAIVSMIVVYKTWSSNGDYTLFSFLVSFLMYGGFCSLMGYIIDEKIKKL